MAALRREISKSGAKTRKKMLQAAQQKVVRPERLAVLSFGGESNGCEPRQNPAVVGVAKQLHQASQLRCSAARGSQNIVATSVALHSAHCPQPTSEAPDVS